MSLPDRATPKLSQVVAGEPQQHLAVDLIVPEARLELAKAEASRPISHVQVARSIDLIPTIRLVAECMQGTTLNAHSHSQRRAGERPQSTSAVTRRVDVVRL